MAGKMYNNQNGSPTHRLLNCPVTQDQMQKKKNILKVSHVYNYVVCSDTVGEILSRTTWSAGNP